MELPNIKELEKLLKMCRKQGITDLSIGGASFKFGELPRDGQEQEEILPDMPSMEDLINYSVMPVSGEQ